MGRSHALIRAKQRVNSDITIEELIEVERAICNRTWPLRRTEDDIDGHPVKGVYEVTLRGKVVYAVYSYYDKSLVTILLPGQEESRTKKTVWITGRGWQDIPIDPLSPKEEARR